MAALHVNVRWHMQQMAPFRCQTAPLISRSQRALRHGRHLHGVNVHVQNTRMGIGALGHALFEHRHHFMRVCMVERLAAFQIPQAPGRAVHHRFRKQGDHIKVAGKLCVHVAHGVDIVVVSTPECREFLMLRRLIPRNQGVN